MLQRLPTTLAQVKAGNNSKELLDQYNWPKINQNNWPKMYTIT